MQYDQNQSLSPEQVNRLMQKYISCLEVYFEALQEACKRAKKSSGSSTVIKTSSIDVLERFIVIGKKIQHLLQSLQEKSF